LSFLASFCYSSAIQNAITAAVKVSKKTTADAEKGFALAPSAKDLKPWYSESTKTQPEEIEDEKQ
jgi:hypothetical protein